MLSSILGLGLMASASAGLALVQRDDYYQDPNLPVDPNLIACGNAFYTADQYTCYSGDFLCPIQYGAPTLPCGPDCYDPNAYSCNDGRLAPPVPSLETNFLIVAFEFEYSSSTFIQAQGFVFTINSGGPLTYCPDNVGTCPPGTTTVFICQNGACSLNVAVPGGQSVYVAPNGALSYTQAHSGVIPDGSATNGFVLEDGQLQFNDYGFVACPSADGSSTQVYVAYPSVSSDCYGIKLATASGNQPGNGAWQYI